MRDVTPAAVLCCVVLAACGAAPPPPAPVPSDTPAPPPAAVATAEPQPQAAPAPTDPPAAAAPQPAGPEPTALRLRSTGEPLSEADVVKMFAGRGYNHSYDGSGAGLPGVVRGTFTHQYDGRDKVVVDHATGLMWERVGSYDHAPSGLVKAGEVDAYVAGLNAGKLAGFGDWRLPTLDELASLIEPEKNAGGYYMVSDFEPGAMWFTLTTDPVAGDSGSVWTVDFGGGQVAEYTASDEYSILLVRSLR